MFIQSCPVCGNTQEQRFSSIPKGKNPARVQCQLCNLIFFPTNIHPKPTYDLHYNLHFFRPGDIRKAGIMAERIAEIVKKHSMNARMLEIGAGNGLTSFLVKQLGFNVDAIEMDVALCNFLAHEYKLNMLCGDFETFNFSQKYNLIYAGHVIEHSENPLGFLKKAHRTLTKKGILFIDTPDGSVAHHAIKTWKHFLTRHKYEHCSIFTPYTMKIAAEKTGFKFRYFRRLHQFQNFQVCLFKQK